MTAVAEPTRRGGGLGPRGRSAGEARAPCDTWGVSYPFLKGHGTENDFVVLPDPDGTVHGDLSADRVRALCDRRAGIGGDGVLRAVRRGEGWFMDYRNADGSVSEMCGNGIRVFARYLHEREGEPFPMEIQTRDGTKVLDTDGDAFTADMGSRKCWGDRGDRPRRGFPAMHCRWATRTPSPLSTTWPRPVRWTSRPSTTTGLPRGGQRRVRRPPRRPPRRDAGPRTGLGETRSCGPERAPSRWWPRWPGDPGGTAYRVDVPGAPSAWCGPRTTGSG